MRVGFLSNQIDNRGTGNALFDYAHYNETLLKNESKIYTYTYGTHSNISLRRFEARFNGISFITGEAGISGSDIDVLYHIKSGADEGFRVDHKIRYAVHAVFDIQVHGDRYAAVSRWLANRGIKIPYVPHIVNLPKNNDKDFIDSLANLSTALRLKNIPDNAVVFGRYGGFETFDIPWVWGAIKDALILRNDVWFLFANTEKSLIHSRVIYEDEISTPLFKTAFINSCDYMLHARTRGETFGIAVGEFASQGKPIITYGGSGERAHLEELGDKAITYNNQSELLEILAIAPKGVVRYAYTEFTPEAVMAKFKEVFLD